MRIIGGASARRLLKVPEGINVRPTPDKVKLAVFNSLGDRVIDARVFDLFAGSGSLGLEALSRGARDVVSVELSARHARFYSANLESLGLPRDAVELRVQDVFAVILQMVAAGRLFDLVLADPPYGPKNTNKRSTSFAQRLLDNPALPRLLAPEGLFILGHTKRDTLELVPLWQERKLLKHGDSLMRFLQVSDAVGAGPAKSVIAPALP
ncbi:MAG: 16S rRNA (guanine(966)-N(2))-methyltransferase RsmD [Pedosphaera sp.]|nr:16S rRNA (guanine(966)-N(2))-methyltransferase RsmD [Pedosphaera sp.]